MSATATMSPLYEQKFTEFAPLAGYLAKAIVEGAGTTINAVGNASGSDGVQALFDVMMDTGHREVLVRALNSPSLQGWIRERLEVFLYGQRRQHTPALFSHLH